MFKRLNVLLCPLCLILLSLAFSFSPILASADGISYKTHVENIGWQEYVHNGELGGTTGQSLRMEAIKIKLDNPKDLSIEYRTHVQDIGWQDYVGEDQLAGTEGQRKRLEALTIRLTGTDAPNYNVFYRVHAEDFGWLGWAKAGEDAGTAGMAKRLEAIEIVLKPASEPAPESDKAPFVQGESQPQAPQPEPEPAPQPSLYPVTYRIRTSNVEFPDTWSVNGQEVVCSPGQFIEGIQIGLSNELKADGGVQYRVHGSKGWTGWVENNPCMAGVPVQAVRIKLTGKLAFLKDIYYRVHAPNVGWTNLARNGEPCGSEGYDRGITAIQIWVTDRAAPPNAVYGDAFTQKPWYWPLDNYHSLSTYFGQNGATRHDGIDIPAASGTPIKSCKDGTVIYVGYGDGLHHTLLYGAFGNLVVVEHDSGEVCYYGHMSRFNTTTGARVGRGQVIGYVGTTGNSLGDHLHLEIYDPGGNLVDPLGYLR